MLAMLPCTLMYIVHTFIHKHNVCTYIHTFIDPNICTNIHIKYIPVYIHIYVFVHTYTHNIYIHKYIHIVYLFSFFSIQWKMLYLFYFCMYQCIQYINNFTLYIHYVNLISMHMNAKQKHLICTYINPSEIYGIMYTHISLNIHNLQIL